MNHVRLCGSFHLYVVLVRVRCYCTQQYSKVRTSTTFTVLICRCFWLLCIKFQEFRRLRAGSSSGFLFSINEFFYWLFQLFLIYSIRIKDKNIFTSSFYWMKYFRKNACCFKMEKKLLSSSRNHAFKKKLSRCSENVLILVSC